MGELTDKIKGNVNEAVGKVKQAIAGDADDSNRTRKDDKLAAEGAGQELKGKAQQFIGKVKGALGDDI
ncbi:MAG TPA: CsbD family protein [Sphingomonas sp.]